MRRLPAPLRAIVDRVLPTRARRRIVRALRHPAVGRVDFGDLRRTTPISREWGFDRGRAIDRHYIEAFLAAQAASIHGRVLEIGTREYTERFGGSRVERSDVLHVSDRAPGVTIVADLTRGDGLPDDAFDCVLMTQTLQFIHDYAAALRTVQRILRPGGTALLTFPGITPISRHDMDRWGDHWRFTSRSTRDVFAAAFPGGEVAVTVYGNVLSAAAFLYGVAAEELSAEELDHVDPDFEVLIGVAARKSGAAR